MNNCYQNPQPILLEQIQTDAMEDTVQMQWKMSHIILRKNVTVVVVVLVIWNNVFILLNRPCPL